MLARKNFFWFLLKPLAIAIVSIVVFWFFINPNNSGYSSAATAVNTFALNVFVGWVFLGAFLILRSDEEWKEVDVAVKSKDRKKFKVAASKRIAPTVKFTYFVMSFFSVISFYLFHYNYFLLAFAVVFGMSFVIVLTVFCPIRLRQPS